MDVVVHARAQLDGGNDLRAGAEDSATDRPNLVGGHRLLERVRNALDRPEIHEAPLTAEVVQPTVCIVPGKRLSILR
jgi:hypothetical protein